MQAGAYQNGTWVIGVAKAGREEGVDMMGGSAIVTPNGEIVAQSASLEDELILAACDLDAGAYIKQNIFNFAAHRRPEHYRLSSIPWAPYGDPARAEEERRDPPLTAFPRRMHCQAGRRRRRQSAAMIAMGDDPDDDGVLHIGAMGQQGALDQAEEGPGVGNRDIDEPGHGGLRQGFPAI